MPLMRALEQPVMPKIATANNNKMPGTLVFTKNVHLPDQIAAVRRCGCVWR
jgi:hypothetical protein